MTWRIAILGAGRMGAGLGRALVEAGSDVTHLVRNDRPAPEGAGLSVGDGAWAGAIARASVILIATPDATITDMARALAGMGVAAQHVVLHLSGRHDRRALQPLEATGAALGSLHPLQAVSDPAVAPQRLRGAFAGIEGDAPAMEAAEGLATAAGMIPVRIPSSAKPGYHAAAAVASNFTVALYHAACRIATRAGVPADAVPAMYLGLLRGTVENLSAGSAAEALTGAIRRGDAETVRAHLAALDQHDRMLYRILGAEALRLAEEAGLDPAAADGIAAALEGTN